MWRKIETERKRWVEVDLSLIWRNKGACRHGRSGPRHPFQADVREKFRQST